MSIGHDTVHMTHGPRAMHAYESTTGAKARHNMLGEFYQAGLDAAEDGLAKPEWALNEVDFVTEKKRVCKEMAAPEDMTMQALKFELRKRGMYKPGLKRWGLVELMREAYMRDSRILRLHTAYRNSIVEGTDGRYDKRIQRVIHETRDLKKTIASAKKTNDEAEKYHLEKLEKRGRVLFLSVAHLEESLAAGTYTEEEVYDAIFVFDHKRIHLFRPKESVHLKKDRFDERYVDLSDYCSTLISRAEEFGRVYFWEDNKSFTALGHFLAKIEDPVTGKNYNSLEVVLKPFWWRKHWAKPEYTKSEQKVVSNFKSGTFELWSVAELLFQSNRTLRIASLLSARKEKERKRMLKLNVGI